MISFQLDLEVENQETSTVPDHLRLQSDESRATLEAGVSQQKYSHR